MMSPTLGFSAVAGLVTSALGWRLRRRHRHVSLYDERPIGMSEADYARRRARRRVWRRVAFLVIDMAAGAAIGWVLPHVLILH